ncbi:hypothetical protein AVEN_233654-1 [Araneus ventricosus]|uniref:Uncharacterized protein n=1 Tax=Araneus ventricosus TaxID=182803 RepID=A0A4Y2EYU2_ARAVE|nr:hypothetical protein AVEN_233653-1 [Araneus ventricosus]GBM33707.1 hypothetical protein AVEN_233654-1 [Araneus ventricosus]
MDRLPAVSDTKASSKCIGTRLAKFRFKGEWIGYWLYQIQKYQVNVSGTNEYQYPHVSDTAKTCINPSLAQKHGKSLLESSQTLDLLISKPILCQHSLV